MGKSYKLKATLSENVNRTFRLESKLLHIFSKNKKRSQVPIIINNFNRLEFLQRQVDWLKSCGHHNIHIIDNCSSYYPLLRYYKKVPATVYFLHENKGHEALWRTHMYQRFSRSFYIYTDPDLLPCDETPTDFVDYFFDVLDRYPNINKVGFGLKTDDLPDCFLKKNEVIAWEKQFYVNEVEKGLFKSNIDTTFSLYRPGVMFQCWNSTLRTGSPYLLRHMPWYEDSNKLSEESLFYQKNSSASGSWSKALQGENLQYNL